MAFHIPPASNDALLSLTRQEHHLQNYLQTLLDAQSSGLLAGLGVKEEGTTGSSTPPSSPPRIPRRPKSVAPTGQPSSKSISLRGARRGISYAIDDLAALKSQQRELLEAELENRGQDLEVVENLTRKQEGLQEAIEHIEAAPTTSRITSLRSEEQTLGTEIAEMETKLYQMKARHRHLLREISGLDNSVQAKLSSYRESLNLAEKEARLFLSRPPAHDGGLVEKEDGFWTLPIERRTLEMAGDDLRGRRVELRKKWRAVEGERVALVEGKELWSEVCVIVGDVEQQLTEEMKVMRGGEQGGGPGMRKVLGVMGKAAGEIEEKLNAAEEKDWRLLVCCIGAELEAIMEGERVLQAACEEVGGNELCHGMDVKDIRSETNGLNGSETSRRSDNGVRLTQPSRESLVRSEDEDDEPGPDLLISHEDDE